MTESASFRSTRVRRWLGPPKPCREVPACRKERGSLYRPPRFPIVVRPKYELPDALGPASLAERRRFYRRSMDFRSAAKWMDVLKAERVYALILGRHSGIYPRRFRHLKNVPLIVDDARDVRDLRPYLVKYLPEGVYYDRNVYTSLDAARKARLDYARAWRSRFFVGQELAFDLDPENLDCPIHGDIEAKMRRHQGLSFCDWEFEEVRRQAAALYDELSARWTRLKVVYSGRGFHVHVFDDEAFRLTRKERSRIATRFARRYAIDEWVTSGEMRLIRLPYSLHGMLCRVAVRRRRTPCTPRSSRGSPRDPSGTRWSRRRARGSTPWPRRPCGSSRASSVSGAGCRRRSPCRPSRAVRAPRGTRNSGGVRPTRREDRSQGGRSELLLSSCPPVAPLPDMRVDGRISGSAGDQARGWLTLVLDVRSSGAWCGFHLECHTGAFAFDEPPLRFRASFGGVIPEAARFRHHAVARDDDDHRVSRARGPDRAARSGPPEPSGDLPVRDRLARRNRPQELEDLSLEGRDLERERNVLQIALSRVDMFEDPGQIWVL